MWCVSMLCVTMWHCWGRYGETCLRNWLNNTSNISAVAQRTNLLQVIPTLTHYKIPGSMYGISGLTFWVFLQHQVSLTSTFWHVFWHAFWQFFCIYSNILSSGPGVAHCIQSWYGSGPDRKRRKKRSFTSVKKPRDPQLGGKLQVWGSLGTEVASKISLGSLSVRLSYGASLGRW